jgi:hypothetical protein
MERVARGRTWLAASGASDAHARATASAQRKHVSPLTDFETDRFRQRTRRCRPSARGAAGSSGKFGCRCKNLALCYAVNDKKAKSPHPALSRSTGRGWSRENPADGTARIVKLRKGEKSDPAHSSAARSARPTVWRAIHSGAFWPDRITPGRVSRFRANGSSRWAGRWLEARGQGQGARENKRPETQGASCFHPGP